MLLPEENKNTDYSSDLKNIDSLIKEMSEAREDFTPKTDNNSKEIHPPPGQQPAPAYDPVNVSSAPPQELTADQKDRAKRTGKLTAETIDFGIASASSLIAKSNDIKPYKADSEDVETLGDAWSEVAEVYDFNISPWMKLAILYPAIYTPKLIKASNDRRLNVMQNKIAEMEKRMDEVEKEKKLKEETLAV